MINVFMKKYTIKIVNLDDFNNILNHYISHHFKKFDLYFYKLTFSLEFTNNIIQSGETTHQLNGDNINKMKAYLLSSIEYFKSRGYIFCNINHITIDIISDKCNVTYEYYINRPMQAFELKLNMIVAKNPELIKVFGGSKNNPLIRQHSHITI